MEKLCKASIVQLLLAEGGKAGSHPCFGCELTPASCMSLSSGGAGDVGGVAVMVVGEAYVGSPKSSNKSSSENDSSCVSSPGTAAASAVSSKSSSSDRSASYMSSSSVAV